MRTEALRDTIATDIPETHVSLETAPLEMDDDLTRRDAWMFGPLIAAAVTLPVIATVLLGMSAWHLINTQASVSTQPPVTFASRWPERELPTVIR